MLRIATVLAALALVLVIPACGGDDGGGADTTADAPAAEDTTEDTGEETTSEEEHGDHFVVPESGIVATLSEGYRTENGSFSSDVPAADLPVEPGSVKAHWYRGPERYVVIYGGISLDDAEPLCPGNSILIETSFESTSNSPTAEGGCEGTLADNAPQEGEGVVACGPLLMYDTDIPAENAGALYASVETAEGNVIHGVTSVISSSDGQIPDIELGASGYTIPAGILPDGTTEVTC
jgi:hypothetical protein